MSAGEALGDGLASGSTLFLPTGLAESGGMSPNVVHALETFARNWALAALARRDPHVRTT